MPGTLPAVEQRRDELDERVDLLGSPDDLERLRVALIRLARRIRVSLAADITASQRSALGTVFLYGPVSIGKIAEHEHVQPPSASKIVSGLESFGYVEREANPADRRASLISLTPAGRQAIDEMQAAGLGFLTGRLTELDPGDVAAIEAALPALERLLGEPS